jgi:adenylate cyclase 10
MDDKGSTLICLWGLSPMAHEDDAARAILCAQGIRRELIKLNGTTCNIGISSGEMFVGVVGTSGSRKEFSVLGDVANLAARIMYYPIKNKQKGKIHVDLNSRNLASSYFKFTYKGHQEFKGKTVSIPIFEPIETEDE